MALPSPLPKQAVRLQLFTWGNLPACLLPHPHNARHCLYLSLLILVLHPKTLSRIHPQLSVRVLVADAPVFRRTCRPEASGDDFGHADNILTFSVKSPSNVIMLALPDLSHLWGFFYAATKATSE